MWDKICDFFGNSGYATWAQTCIIVASIYVALISISHTDKDLSVSNAFSFGQKYYLDAPSASTATLQLRLAQIGEVRKARNSIPNYNDQSDPDHAQLFAKARPLVADRIYKDKNLNSYFNRSSNFFTAMMLCVSSSTCDRESIKKLLAYETLGFYNAACSYIELVELQSGNRDVSLQISNFLLHVGGYPDDLYFCPLNRSDKIKT